MEKKFKTYDEQLGILKSRGIDFSVHGEYRRAMSKLNCCVLSAV